MGTRYDFHCNDCGLDAKVSGGDDRGRFIATRTMFCTQCKALYDVLIENTEDPTNPIPEDCRLKPDDLGKCPKCRNAELTPWKSGERCPRCGGTIETPKYTSGVLDGVPYPPDFWD